MRIRTNAKAGAEVVARAAAGRERDIIQGYRVSTIPAALASGDEWTDLVFAADLRRLYPDFLAFDCEGLHAFGQDVTASRGASRACRPDGTVLMQDAAWRRLDACGWTAALAAQDHRLAPAATPYTRRRSCRPSAAWTRVPGSGACWSWQGWTG